MRTAKTMGQVRTDDHAMDIGIFRIPGGYIKCAFCTAYNLNGVMRMPAAFVITFRKYSIAFINIE